MRAPPPPTLGEQARRDAEYAAFQRKAARQRPFKQLGYAAQYLSLTMLYTAGLISSYIDNRAEQRRKNREWLATGELHKSKEPLPFNAQVPINEMQTKLARSHVAAKGLPIKQVLGVLTQLATIKPHFLSLPPEVRDQMYKYLLSNKTFHIV